MNTPLDRYRKDLSKGNISPDHAQEKAVEYTQELYEELISEYESEKNYVERLKKRLIPGRKKLIKGLYFWGGVGRGKTYIVDAFYECLNFEEKRRIHFHRFMQMVHHELKKLENVENPLEIVADKLAADITVICFDEFHVSDITDAMLLGGLLKALFEKGVTLVTTSNEHPDKLYQDGLQRERFLPAIELIKNHTHVIKLDSGIDYRLRYLDKAEIYHYPLDEKADDMLLTHFNNIATQHCRVNSTIEIEGRKIRVKRFVDGVVWFDFYELCDGPRGPADYIEIARQYQTVLIGNVPQLDEGENDLARRFMTMVDEFYDRNVKLIIAAQVEPGQLYRGKRLAKQFKRTVSRLTEMQTHDFLAMQHLSE